MSIDTAEKRRSIVGILTGFMPVGVTPNASKDVEWRQQVGWGYSGILPGGAVAAIARKCYDKLTLRLTLGC